MVKLICLINRPDDKSPSEFKDWWLNHHSRVAAKLPHLVRYTINTVVKDDLPGAGFDGVAELWFESREEMERAFASEEGQECSREDADLIGNRIAFLVDEHVIVS